MEFPPSTEKPVLYLRTITLRKLPTIRPIRKEKIKKR
jgi:hypothetical protein